MANERNDNIKKGVHGCSREDKYIAPTDPLIKERLEWFQDQKLALMMHFGPYAQMGVNVSWPLSAADDWARCDMDWEEDLDTFREQYVNLNKSFNPMRLQPKKWAEFAKENGFKYLIFTTKHHDGFCMFDTKYTDYKVTSPDCPFHTHKYANIVKSVFDAFRDEGLGIAAYFSKSDWNCPWYWAKGMEIPWGTDRYPTYKPEEHPELWEKFTEFTHNQMMELVEDYGRLDILWLDGAQVREQFGLGIHIDEFFEKARKVQPWLITADRLAGTVYENYITPEQAVPDHVIRVPWESCVTLGNKWMYQHNEPYKSTDTVIKMLLQVVSRGGNLALNVGPQPDGQLPLEAMNILRGLGDWLKVNGEAIYGTRATDLPQTEHLMYTKKGDTLYAFITVDEGDVLPETVLIPCDKEVKQVKCLAAEQPLAFTKTDAGLSVRLPDALVGTNPTALAFELL